VEAGEALVVFGVAEDRFDHLAALLLSASSRPARRAARSGAGLEEIAAFSG
jgi:hypothetical protein